MKQYKTFVIAAIILLISAITVVWLVRITATTMPPLAKENSEAAGPIIEKRYKIVLEDTKLDHRQEDFSEENIKAYFSNDIIDVHTYNFLQHLDDVVENFTDDQDALEKIRQYLDDRLPPDQAEKMFDLYALYLDYQRNWQDHLKDQGMPLSPEEALENLADLQEYRRAVFGDENADMIFGASVEAQEYKLRHDMILYDDTLYGAEKEAQLKALNEDMWGDELTAQNPATAYDRYQETMRLYQKDLSELRTDEERQAFTQQLRLDAFDPVQRQAFEEAQLDIDEEKQVKQDYYSRENEILNDASLSDAERTEMIRQLQDDTFGDEADAFRRREAMRKAAEQMAEAQASDQAPDENR